MKVAAGGNVSGAIDGFVRCYINIGEPQPKRMRLTPPPPIRFPAVAMAAGQPQADVAVQPQPTSASLIPDGGLLPADGLPASISQSASESEDGLDWKFDPIHFLGGDNNTTNAGRSGGLDPAMDKLWDQYVAEGWDEFFARGMAAAASAEGLSGVGEAASAAEHAEQKMEEEAPTGNTHQAEANADAERRVVEAIDGGPSSHDGDAVAVAPRHGGRGPG